MKRIFLVIATMVFFIVPLIGCASGNNVTKLMPPTVNYADELDINSPEGLAKESSRIYKAMLSGEMDAQTGFASLLEISSEQSVQGMMDYQEEFIQQVEAAKEYFDAQDNAIDRFEFAQTEYSDDQTATIKRIQIQQDGKEYYFSQDYVLEDGQWRIKGDNPENDFVILHRFLFWYL